MNAVAEPVSPSATIPRQRRGKPLLSVGAVKSLIDKTEDQVKGMAEDGSLAWVFEVSSDPNRAHKKELRILPAAVASYLRGQPCLLEWADVLRLMLPHDEPMILSKDITRILNVSSSHTYHLARRKLIVPCSTWHRGRGGCARFSAKSFVDFLKTRRFP